MTSKHNHSWRYGSAWPMVISAIAFAFLTVYFWLLYGAVHWKVMPQVTSIGHDVREAEAWPSIFEINSSTQSKIKGELNRMSEHVLKLENAALDLMWHLSIYRLTGGAALLSMIAAYFRRPSWAGWIALPFGLVSALLSLSAM